MGMSTPPHRDVHSRSRNNTMKAITLPALAAGILVGLAGVAEDLPVRRTSVLRIE
jgi:hypothetical protein